MEGGQMYRCVRCDENVDDGDREDHSASAAHQSNGGSSTVVEDDYEPLPEPRGTSKTR
jgi:hypothetical protein